MLSGSDSDVQANVVRCMNRKSRNYRTVRRSETAGDCGTEDAFAYAHDLIGNLNAGMNRWIDWNLIVDKTEVRDIAEWICGTDDRK